jgi:hypothetical protein
MSEPRREVCTILREARALIADRNRWTARVVARNADGFACHPCAAEAVRWCALGAIHKVAAGGKSAEIAFAAILDIEHRDIAVVNDYIGHADVLAMLDRVIAALAVDEPLSVEEELIPA